ncbi:MAG: hypothetical protein N2376_01450 [Clostridia bacterium]|nr:hypothetical protein [Clostridia bacterium]
MILFWMLARIGIILLLIKLLSCQDFCHGLTSTLIKGGAYFLCILPLIQDCRWVLLIEAVIIPAVLGIKSLLYAVKAHFILCLDALSQHNCKLYAINQRVKIPVGASL